MSRPNNGSSRDPGARKVRGGAGIVPPTTRRLQRMGAVTLGVSLPRAWVGQRGLASGQSIHLRTLPDGSLVLQDAMAAEATSAAILDVGPSEPAEHLFRRLIAAYLGGASIFQVCQPSGITSETRAICRSFLRRTAHTESVSEEPETVVLRDLSNGSTPPVPDLLRRMYQLVEDLHRDAGATWQRISETEAGTLDSRDDEIDRYAWLIERSLRREGVGSGGADGSAAGTPDGLRYLLWARDLERIADHAVQIGEHGARLNEASPPDSVRRLLSSYHGQALEHLRASQAVALAPDARKANDLLDLGEALHQTEAVLADRILLRGSGERLAAPAIRSLGLILQSIDRTTAYAQNLAEIGLDRDVERHERAPLRPTEPLPSLSSIDPTRGGIPSA